MHIKKVSFIYRNPFYTGLVKGFMGRSRKSKVTPMPEASQYVITIVGQGGRLKDLEGVIYGRFEPEKQKKGVELLCQGKGTVTFPSHHVYWTERSPEEVKFEIYDDTPVVTSTKGFRQGLGELLTMLLQTGYTVASEQKTGTVKLDF